MIVSEKRKEYLMAYKEANKEKINEYAKAYREANKEKITEYNKAYWKANKEKLAYTFEQDLNTIQIEMEKNNIEDATTGEQHPLILRLLLGRKITLETVVILNKGLDFIDDFKDDLILKDTCLLVKKYGPFITKNTITLLNNHRTLINIIARTRNSSNTKI